MKDKKRKISEGILFTDFYQLTMAQLYYEMKLHNMEVQFDYFFRNYPNYGKHQAGYCVNAGLEWLLDWMKGVRFGDNEVDYLKRQKSKSGKPLFKKKFLKWLKENGNFEGISIRSIPEGRVTHANTPTLIARGPFAMAQVLESSLLNHLNYQTLVATKASRIYEAGFKRPLIDFGMRRAQGKSANAGTRAALIGGADFSSNTGISYCLGYSPKGTHAHSVVQAFMTLGLGELEAFRRYAEIYPDDCILLVDTIDTLNSGIPNAIKIFEELRRKGHEPVGIRLDSGDLAYLSIQAAKMLDKAGFKDTSIVLSNQLDEMVIWQIISQIRTESKNQGVDADNLINRLVYGVGTRMLVSQGNAALDGIYKLTAVKKSGKWIPSIKISETPTKVINPGCKSLYRVYDKRDIAVADLIALEDENIEKKQEIHLHHPVEPDTHRLINKGDLSYIELLLVDILKEGKLVYKLPTIEDMRKARQKDLNKLDSGVRRFINPHRYHVSLTKKLWELKQNLVKKQKVE